MSYDRKCFELAHYFSPHDWKLKEVSDLAQAIQDAIENFMAGRDA